MAFDAKTERLISLKKLSGKAHTSNDKGLANEGLPSGLTVSAASVFGQNIPGAPSTTLYGITNNAVEYLRLSASFIAGTDTATGRHGFSLHLPDDYETSSSNPNAGTYPYTNSQTIYITSGALQLVPPSFATSYEASPYHTGSGETSIPVLDARDWNIDYFNGIFFQQDPPGTGDHSSNPRYVDAHLYIGDYLGTAGNFTTITGSLTQLSDGTSYLIAGSNVTITSASNGQITIAASGGGGSGDITAVTAGTGLSGGATSGDATLNIDTSVVPRLGNSNTFSDANTFTGDVFLSGSVSDFTATGSVKFNAGLSGSLTHLTNGTSFLRAGDNVTIATGSDGSVLITADGTFSIDDDIVATLTGSNFSGPAKFNSGLTGSLTSLVDGRSYLSAGSNVTITSASNGQIIIASTSTSTTDITGLKKFVKVLPADVSAGTSVSFSDLLLGGTSNTSGSIDVFLNGQILISGSQSVVSAGNADYYAHSTNAFKFGFGLSSDDVVTVKQLLVSSGTGTPGGSDTQVQFNDGGSFAGDSNFTFNSSTDTLTVSNITGSMTKTSGGLSYLVAGSNVTITSASNGQITIASTGESVTGLNKFVKTLTADVSAGTAVTFSDLSLGSSTNTSGSIDVFLNGQILVSGTSTQVSNGNADYYAHSTNAFKFGFAASIDDVITVKQTVLSAGGSGTPGGSNTQVQFNNDGSFDGDSDFTFNSTTNTLTVPKLSGSLTRLASGLSYLVGGENVTITTSSSGQVTIQSAASSIATTRNKSSYIVTGTHAALAGLTIANTDFSVGHYSSNLIDVVYNGMILYSGTQVQVSAGNADYTLAGQSEVKFGFALSADDIIHTNIITSGTVPSGGSSTAPYVTYASTSDLSAERVLTGLDGIVLDTSESGQLQLKIERIKTVYYLTGTHASNVPLTIEGASFNSGSYNEKRIDVYVNGQLMTSGSSRDYVLVGNETDVTMKYALEEDDTVVVVVQ